MFQEGLVLGPSRLRALLTSYGALGALLGAVCVLALLTVPELPHWLAPLGIVPGLVYYFVASRRERRRQQILRQPFPESYRDVLRRRVPFYRQLGPVERRRFEGEVLVFLDEQRIYSLSGGTELTDEHRVLIAASAATLLLGRPEWRLPRLRDIVVYPGAFTEETYEVGPYSHTVGMVHSQGPILLSLPALLHSYPEDGGYGAPTENVGLHEFAHVIDFAFSGEKALGVPGRLPEAVQRSWYQQFQLERERLVQGDSVLHPYALKSEAEMFAVSVESFFTEPVRLRTQHPALYRMLAGFLNQDPAARALPAPAAFFPWVLRPVRYLA